MIPGHLVIMCLIKKGPTIFIYHNCSCQMTFQVLVYPLRVGSAMNNLEIQMGATHPSYSTRRFHGNPIPMLLLSSTRSLTARHFKSTGNSLAGVVLIDTHVFRLRASGFEGAIILDIQNIKLCSL